MPHAAAPSTGVSPFISAAWQLWLVRRSRSIALFSVLDGSVAKRNDIRKPWALSSACCKLMGWAVCMIQARGNLVEWTSKKWKKIVLASTGSQPIRNSSILNSQKPWGETRVKQAQPTRKPIRRDTVIFVKLEGMLDSCSYLSEE